MIALLTDFGEQDWFVGTMKGVIAGIARDTRIVDLCHQVRPGAVREGAFVLEAAYPYFPAGTIFCCVVDPGVGGPRRALVAQDGRCIFVAPDNGLVERFGKLFRAAENFDLFLPEISQTFHGRDVFAPLAAYLAAGVPLEGVGPIIDDPVSLDWPLPRFEKHRAIGEILYVDRFGNLITNLRTQNLLGRYGETRFQNARLRIQNLTITGPAHNYSGRPAGELLFYGGSAGYMEIAESMGDAAARLRAGPGDEVQIDVPV